MFVREKKIKGYSYLYLVESVREGKRTKQRIIRNLGRKDVVPASGGLERLAASIARFAASVEVRSKLDVGDFSEDELEALCCQRIGAPLLFGRLWEETGCAAVIDNDGRPICSEIMPGKTADVSVFLPVVDRKRSRFGITRVCVVADRGMISAATITVFVEDQGGGERAQLDQPAPIGGVARQAGDFEAHDDHRFPRFTSQRLPHRTQRREPAQNPWPERPGLTKKPRLR